MTKRSDLIEVSCIDCGHIVTVDPDRKEEHLHELGWEKKGGGWQCPHCYYERK
jgi:DNA-directed RNA polymerase subunit RPC12/RpoP